MPNTHTTPASVASRLTDEEILKLSKMAEYNFSNDAAAVLRDYVRIRGEQKLALVTIGNQSDEIARLKARLESVVKECEIMSDCMKKAKADAEREGWDCDWTQDEVERFRKSILRAARGDSENENKQTRKESKNEQE